MADCGFEKDIGNALKMGILGLALGAIGWLVFGAVKSGRSYEQSRRQRPAAAYRPPPEPRRRSSSGWTTTGT